MNGQGLFVLFPALIVHVYFLTRGKDSVSASMWTTIICIVIVGLANRSKATVGLDSSLDYAFPYLLIWLVSSHSNKKPWVVAFETVCLYIAVLIVFFFLSGHSLLQFLVVIAAMFAQYLIIITYFEDYSKRTTKNG
jgi:hypothetical protein